MLWWDQKDGRSPVEKAKGHNMHWPQIIKGTEERKGCRWAVEYGGWLSVREESMQQRFVQSEVVRVEGHGPHRRSMGFYM